MLNLEDKDTLTLLHNCYADYYKHKSKFEKMYAYYRGNSDALKQYKMVTDRSNSKINTNFIKKFVKEEVSYSVGNDVTYISKSGDKNIVNDIDYYMAHWSKKHDSNLAKWMLLYGYDFELYYIDKQNQFCSRIITPRDGYVYTDENGEILFFMHFYHKRFDTNIYIDLYDEANIYHLDIGFNKVAEPTAHIFGMVPVSIAQTSEEHEDDTIYKDIKGLQDAYETNLSDISNEISDFRNAYLAIAGFKIDEEDIPKMKELGVIQIPTIDGKINWLIKNINDSFIQNTLNTEEDKMYQLTSHINHNEKMQSNLSGVALRSRLISLEEKCKINQKALADCIMIRLQMLFIYLKKIENINYDYRDIQTRFTPNIPQDDLNTANIINTLGPQRLSTMTALSLLSFINNPENEIKKIEQENKADSIGGKLLNGSGTGGDV